MVYFEILYAFTGSRFTVQGYVLSSQNYVKLTRDFVERSSYIQKKTNKLRVRLLIKLFLVCPTSLRDVTLARQVRFTIDSQPLNPER